MELQNKLHRLFDCKHDRRIAQGVIELLEDAKQQEAGHLFYKDSKGDFARFTVGASGNPLTVAYGGAARIVIQSLIREGEVKIAEKPETIREGVKGFRLERNI